MSNEELFALSVLVQAQASQCLSFDQARLSKGYSVGYGDQPVEGQRELEAELRTRGILKG